MDHGARIQAQVGLRSPWEIEPVCSEQAHHTDRTAPLAEWLEWAERYIEMADPLARFRERKEVVRLYVSGYGHEIARMRTQGFEDPDPPTYEPEKAPPPGIRLQDVKPIETGLPRPWRSTSQRIWCCRMR